MSFFRSIAGKTVNSEPGRKQRANGPKMEDNLQTEATKTFSSLFSNLIVLHGPFKGMKYPAFERLAAVCNPD